MKNIEQYIKSGILEMYVLGLTSEEESYEITKLSSTNIEIKNEIEAIENSMMLYAEDQAGDLDPTIKPMVMASIDYTERLKAGEAPGFPPLLNETSNPTDYKEWLTRADMNLPKNFKDVYVKIIGIDKTTTSAIVWFKEGSPYEIHNKEIEKFLIIEGTCDIITEEKTYSLKPGNYLSIPLFMGHEVKVTSKNPCKVILQRMAA